MLFFSDMVNQGHGEPEYLDSSPKSRGHHVHDRVLRGAEIICVEA